MKKTAIKWIIAASAIIFFIGGTAWADGKGNKGHNTGHSSGYQSAPIHNGGHGSTNNYQKRPPLGKYPQHEAFRSPYHKAPQGPKYDQHRRPVYQHQKPHHNGRIAKVVVVKKRMPTAVSLCRSSPATRFLHWTPSSTTANWRKKRLGG